MNTGKGVDMQSVFWPASIRMLVLVSPCDKTIQGQSWSGTAVSCNMLQRLLVSYGRHDYWAFVLSHTPVPSSGRLCRMSSWRCWMNLYGQISILELVTFLKNFIFCQTSWDFEGRSFIRFPQKPKLQMPVMEKNKTKTQQQTKTKTSNMQAFILRVENNQVWVTTWVQHLLRLM